jgi:hypothetical protein
MLKVSAFMLFRKVHEGREDEAASKKSFEHFTALQIVLQCY